MSSAQTAGSPTVECVVISGISGAGKSTVVRALEDAGFFCVDNIPVLMLPKLIELIGEARSSIHRVGLVIDIREREFLDHFSEVYGQLASLTGQPPLLVFLECEDRELLRRFSETRRRHPADEHDVGRGIALERKVLEPIREKADVVLDTSRMTIHDLRREVLERVAHGADTPRMAVSLRSFGFKHGPPPNTDLLFDVRFLPNPYFVEGLKERSGLEEAVSAFVLEQDESRRFCTMLEDLLRFCIPRFEAEGKSYLTISFGCTGGRHRSVAIAEEMRRRLSGVADRLSVEHRDIEREPEMERSR